MGKMKEIAMSNQEALEEATNQLTSDTKELAHETFKSEVDVHTIKKVVEAIFEGVLHVLKKL